ncbi:MAG: LuxR C-terminal-related transcriptional regulator [Bacteroidales bacterium]|nr:LuxR C-terminal-related transcriptional regulator [Bacteroidales bacterium]
MRNILFIILAIAAIAASSCSRSSSRNIKAIDDAEALMENNLDSAMSILDAIEPADLTADSTRAKYIYLKAWGHMRQNRSMISDSLISRAHNYYKGKDITREIQSGTALAWYKFWVGDTSGAISMLDSLAAVADIPDSLLTQTLRIRVLLGASEYQGKQLIPLAKKLVAMEIDTLRKMEAQYMLVSAYEYAEEPDSALTIIDRLIDYARANRWGEKQFYFETERAQILGEMGRSAESDATIDMIFAKSSPDNGAADYLHMQYAMNALNRGDIRKASSELAIADSFAARLREIDDTYYRSYSNLMHTMIDFKQTGKMKLSHVNAINNRQHERYNRIKASQWESERGALEQQNRAMALKAESDHKTMAILVISLTCLLLLAAAGMAIRQRRRRELENEERAEALQKMVDELKQASAAKQTDDKTPAALRRAMIKQLGIIKMVAETPTEQNREMLRKISSIEKDTGGELVDWDNLFELINNLYAGFHSRLLARYGDLLTLKEQQIIVLMMADFSTKEMSVITTQTTATIYVRKSSIRKKLGVPEKQDIVAFLRQSLTT